MVTTAQAVLEAVTPHFAARPTPELERQILDHAQLMVRKGDPEIQFWSYRCLGTDRPDVYFPMIEHLRYAAGKFTPNSQTWVIDGREIDMLARAVAMCTFVHSPAFTAPTFFLDNDAFPNADLRGVEFDHIGVTVRDNGPDQGENAGLMPVNEGVILAKPTDEARAFFMAYAGTYEAIAKTFQIDSDGKDVRWWGGQIALNVVSKRLSHLVKEFSCETWNFSPERGRDYPYEELNDKKVIHLKGGRKKQFDHLKAYQEQR